MRLSPGGGFSTTILGFSGGILFFLVNSRRRIKANPFSFASLGSDGDAFSGIVKSSSNPVYGNVGGSRIIGFGMIGGGESCAVEASDVIFG